MFLFKPPKDLEAKPLISFLGGKEVCLLFVKIYFNWRLIALQYCGGFSHTLTWISHGCTCVPHPEPPSHLPPHAIPQRHPSAPALSTLPHASNLDWWSISHTVIYIKPLISYIPWTKTELQAILKNDPKVIEDSYIFAKKFNTVIKTYQPGFSESYQLVHR